MKPPSVFAATVSRTVDPTVRRAAALARVRIVPPVIRRLTHSQTARRAHDLAAERGIPFVEALNEVRKTRREASR